MYIRIELMKDQPETGSLISTGYLSCVILHPRVLLAGHLVTHPSLELQSNGMVRDIGRKTRTANDFVVR